jgi:cytochrome c-type biogenesis protein CcmE
MAQMTNQAQAIPSDLIAQRSGRGNLKFVIGGVLLLAVVIALIVQATMSTGAYYMTVNEVHSGAANLVGQRIRVNGAVVPGSEDWNAQQITLRFAISDETSNQQLPIVFYGPRPDNFQRAASAIIEGERCLPRLISSATKGFRLMSIAIVSLK